MEWEGVDGLYAARVAWRSDLERAFPSYNGDGDYRRDAEDAERVERFNTEGTEEKRRTQRKRK
jgi:hypothetical protein